MKLTDIELVPADMISAIRRLAIILSDYPYSIEITIKDCKGVHMVELNLNTGKELS